MQWPSPPSRAGAPASTGNGRRLIVLAFTLAWTLAPLIASAQDAVPSPSASAAPDSAAHAVAARLPAHAPASHALAIRGWVSFGPYRPPADPDHWVDPRGTGIAVFGVGVAAAPIVTLGIEGITWFASYAAVPASGFLVRTSSRMHGEFLGLGPVCSARLAYGRYEPWASATLLLVKAHLEWPATFIGLPGDAELENRWKGTLAIGAGLGVRLWRDGGVALRYENVPLSADFGAPSKGSANAGVNSVLLSVYGDVSLSRMRPGGRSHGAHVRS